MAWDYPPDAWLRDLTRKRREEARAGTLPPEIFEAVAPVIAKARRAISQHHARRAWREGQWEAGNRWCAYCTGPVVRQGHRVGCNHPQLITVDHRIPTGRDGPDDPSNWVIACRRCNGLKADTSEAEFRALLAAEADG